VWEVNGRGEKPLPKASSGREGFAREWEGKKLTRKPLPKASVRFVRGWRFFRISNKKEKDKEDISCYE